MKQLPTFVSKEYSLSVQVALFYVVIIIIAHSSNYQGQLYGFWLFKQHDPSKDCMLF